MIHSVEISFLLAIFQTFEAIEREQSRQILLDLDQFTSDTSFTLLTYKTSGETIGILAALSK